MISGELTNAALLHDSEVPIIHNFIMDYGPGVM